MKKRIKLINKLRLAILRSSNADLVLMTVLSCREIKNRKLQKDVAELMKSFNDIL